MSSSTPTILVVDDTPDNLTLMIALLRDSYRIKVANSGARALAIAATTPPPDLILLDVMMPGIDGYEVCRRLKAAPATRDIPVIFLTARSDAEDECYGLELGAVDYITKPISAHLVLARVKNHLLSKGAADFLRDKNGYLEQEVARRIAAQEMIQDAAIQIVTSLAETRDPQTGYHIRRTMLYVKSLAEALAEHPRFSHYLTPPTIQQISKSAMLHDIGKVGIPDHILLKPGRLTQEEFTVMQSHTTLGHAAIARAEEVLGMSFDFLRIAKEIALHHHEHWDGHGYPCGLAGDAIPISARLMAIADVYDALITVRVYKEAISHEEAMAIMQKGRGSQFDADMLDAFCAIQPAISAIAETYKDSPQAASAHP
jgi:putative two-component system response regulator